MPIRHGTPVDPNPGAVSAPVVLSTSSSANLFTGAYTQTFSPPLPRARNGFLPTVSLVYSSDAGAGLVGQGWNLPVPHVARDLSFGMPLYREMQASELGPLVYQLGGSAGRLSYVSSPQDDLHLFRPEFEDGAFLRFYLHWEARDWEVFDAAGNRWVLGASADSRDSEGDHIFAWYVDTIEDRHANQISYTYLKRDGVLYPLCIEYDRGAPLPAYPRIGFTWESAAEVISCPPFIDVCVDDHRISYMKGFRADYSRKLTRVTVTGYDENGQGESFAYDLAYRACKSYGKGKQLGGGTITAGSGKTSTVPSLSFMGGNALQQIRPEDSAPGCSSPATSFRYFDVQEDYAQRRELTWPHHGRTWTQSIRSTETNVYSHEFKSHSYDVTTKKYIFGAGPVWEESDAWIMTKSMLVDVDGDGKLDLLFVDTGGSWRFYRNNGGFAFDPVPIDITLPAGPDVRALECTLSVSKTDWAFVGDNPDHPLKTVRTDSTYQMILDVNGDGYADIVRSEDGVIRVFLGGPDQQGWKFSDGEVWWDSYNSYKYYKASIGSVLRETHTSFDRAGSTKPGQGTVTQWVLRDLLDMNGDGLPDYLIARVNDIDVCLNEGKAFASKPYTVTLPKEAYSHAGEPCLSESIGEFRDAYEDIWGKREMQVSLCKTMALIDLNGDQIPDLVLNDPWETGLSFGCPKDAKSFRFAPGTLGGFDTAHYTTVDLSNVPVMCTLPAGTWTDKNGEEGLFIDMNGDGLKDYVLLGRQDRDKIVLFVRYNTGHGFLPGYGWEIVSPAGDWAALPDVEHLTNCDDTFDELGTGVSYLRRALVDIDGDGAVEMINIVADRGGIDYWRIYSRLDPATPLGRLSGSHSETGLYANLTYGQTTQDVGSRLPFPKWHLKTLECRDEITQRSLTQEYAPTGSYYNPVRREFSGFARGAVTDPTRRLEYSFWNSPDAAHACKHGQLRSFRAFSADKPGLLLAKDEVEYARIGFPGEAREWARPEKITLWLQNADVAETAYEYEGGALANLGLVKEVVFNRGTAEERRDTFEYCVADPGASPGRALVRTRMVARKDKNGLHELARTKYLYDLNDCPDGCTGLTHGDLSAVGKWQNGQWALWNFEYDPLGRLCKTTAPDGVTYTYAYYGNTPYLKVRSCLGAPDFSVFYIGYHPLTGNAQKIGGPAHRAGHSPAEDPSIEYIFDKFGRVLSAGGTMSEVTQVARDQLAKGSWRTGIVQRIRYHDLVSASSPARAEGSLDPFLGGAIAERSLSLAERGLSLGRLGHRRRWVEYFDAFGALVLLEQQADKGHLTKLYIDYTPLGYVHRTWARITSDTPGYARYTSDAASLKQSFSYHYDALGRIVRVTNPDGTFARFEFEGNAVRYEDELKHRFEVEMNRYGEVVAKRSWTGGGIVVDPNTGASLPVPPGDLLESTYEYDGAGRLIRAIDPEGGIYEYEYELDGNLTRVHTPVSDTSFDYTTSGKLWRVKKSSGAVVEVEYDGRGRLSWLREHPGKGSAAADYREHHYIYDVSPDPALGTDEEYAGRLSEVHGTTYRLTFGYNGQGGVDRVALHVPKVSPQPLMWVERLYLATGELLQARYSSNQAVLYEYDYLGRLSLLDATGFAGPGEGQSRFTATVDYTAGGQFDRVWGMLAEVGSGRSKPRSGRGLTFARTHGYGSNCMVSSVETQVSGQAPWYMKRWYWDNGQISRVRDDGLRGTDRTYHYDGANRLVQADGYWTLADETINPTGQITFAYHKNSSLESVTANQFAEAYTYDHLKQQLLSRSVPQGICTYVHDGDGQRWTEKTPGEDIEYRWTGGGNLAQLKDLATGKVAQFEYSPDVGRWLANRDGHKTYYLDTLEFDETANCRSLHLPLPGGIVATLRTVGPDTCAFFDEHGPAAVFTTAGQLLEKAEYLPYGEKRVLAGGGGSVFGYAGKQFEELARLSNFGARYYDARARQWISADTSLTAATPASSIFGLDALQPYVYASADPISKVDAGGVDSTWKLTLAEAAMSLFGSLPACTVAVEAGVKNIAHRTGDPAANLAAATLSLHSATHAGRIALGEVTEKVEIGLVGRLLAWLLPARLAWIAPAAAGAASLVNVGFAGYYAIRGGVGLARLGGRILDSMKATPEQERLSLFSKWYESGLRTAEDVELQVTHEGEPGWKATPLGLWYDEEAARDILREEDMHMCLADRSNINRAYPPNLVPIPYKPLSDFAKSFEKYVDERQHNVGTPPRGAAPGAAPAPPATLGGVGPFPNDPSNTPQGGISSAAGGSDAGWDWDLP